MKPGTYSMLARAAIVATLSEEEPVNILLFFWTHRAAEREMQRFCNTFLVPKKIPHTARYPDNKVTVYAYGHTVRFMSITEPREATEGFSSHSTWYEIDHATAVSVRAEEWNDFCALRTRLRSRYMPLEEKKVCMHVPLAGGFEAWEKLP